MSIGDVTNETPSLTSLALEAGDYGEARPSSSRQPGSRQVEAEATGSGKQFTEHAVRVFHQLRQEGQMCDALIHTQGGATFPVHRNILAASSEYFKAQFYNRDITARNYNELRQPQEVVLDDVNPEVMTFLVDYVYGRPVTLTVDNVQTVFSAADRFLLSDLVTDCCRFMRQNLCAENCLGIAAFARAMCRPGLRRAATAFAHSHFSDVVLYSQEFLRLDADRVFEYLSSDCLNVRNEEHVFDAICLWIHQDPSKRASSMPRLLRCVRLGFLSMTYLVETLKKNEYVCDSAPAKVLVVEALKYVCNLASYDDFHRRISRGLGACNAMARPRIPHEILFVIGGWSGGSPTDIIETYDTRAGRWLVCRPPGCEARAYHACLVLGRMIYVLGGFNGVEYFSSCRKFDAVSIRWYPATPMNSRRCYVSGVALRGKLYALGGFDGHVRLNTVERFDPQTNQWSYSTPMIQQRSDAKATVLDDKIYICGGFNGQECLCSAECYDPDAKQWTLLTPMRNRRSGVGVAAYRGCIYALGGFNGITRMNTGEKYDPSTRQWITVADMNTPRSNFAIGVADDLLFAIGGFNGVTTVSLAEYYDAVTDQWNDVASLSLYRSALSACVVSELPNIRDYVFKPPHPTSPMQGPGCSTGIDSDLLQESLENDPNNTLDLEGSVRNDEDNGQPRNQPLINDDFLNQLA